MRRRAATVSLLLLAGVLLAWWRRRARTPPAAPPTGGAAPGPVPPTTVPPASAVRFVSVPWTLAAAPDERAELTIRYAGRPDLELDRVDAQETPTQVFVTVLLRPCAAAATEPAAADGTAAHEATVPLSGPLGARELVHAPADPPPLYP
ncbi:MAG TPA: hypothetical protein VFU94_10785 [Conexibacter sp.]|nr:hypothetical protein [Conexibacter sp.]